MSQIIIMATIIIYLAAVVYIGVLCSKKNNAVDDFYLGGRKLGPFVTAMSAEASDMSSWLLMGLPGLAYLTGVADAAWTAIGLARLQTLTVKIRFLQYVTAMLTYVMHFVHHSYLIHQTCLVQLMLPMLKRINVLPVDVALSSVLPEQ